VKLTVVGYSGSFPGPQSPASCYLVEHEGSRVLLDLGNGALGHLQRHVDIYDIDAVILSHLHVDHFIDLCSFYVARTYRPGGASAPIPVYGPPATLDRVVAAYGSSTSAADFRRVFDFVDLSQRFTHAPFTVTTQRMRHPVEAYAIRLEASGRSITYSGDTGPNPDLVELARGTDLALFEASFLTSKDNPPDLHMSAAQAADHARRADAGRLVLTHLVPWNRPADTLSEAAAVVDEPTLASAGLVIDL